MTVCRQGTYIYLSIEAGCKVSIALVCETKEEKLGLTTRLPVFPALPVAPRVRYDLARCRQRPNSYSSVCSAAHSGGSSGTHPKPVCEGHRGAGCRPVVACRGCVGWMATSRVPGGAVAAHRPGSGLDCFRVCRGRPTTLLDMFSPSLFVDCCQCSLRALCSSMTLLICILFPRTLSVP